MKELTVKQLNYSTSQEAWEGINEIFIRAEPKFFLESNGGLISSGSAFAYNVIINIHKAWFNPEFDFGKIFNYQQTKWTLLINNYVNLNQLDLVRSQVRAFGNKKRTNYNLAFSFSNSHSNGKGCLLNVCFCKRLDIDVPILIASLRSSEITKRLAFDLVLLQRLGEYVYGENQTFMIQLNCNQMYCNAETLIHYHLWKPLKRIIKDIEEPNKWTLQLLKLLKYFKTVDEKDIKYKVYRRVLACIQPNSVPEKKVITMTTDKLLLSYDDIPYPEDCISYSQRLKFKRTFLHKQKMI